MSPVDRLRRTRRTALLLSAILIPTAAVVLLVVRVVRQETELAERRAAAERREALDQLRRELAARLQALRLEEVNRLIGEPGRRLPPDSPILFVASIEQDRMALPWQDTRVAPRPSVAFLRRQRDGESLEFQAQAGAAAAATYQRALDAAQSPWERCSALLALGRSYAKAAMTAEQLRADRTLVDTCGDVSDADGVPLALYAAARLLDRGQPDPEASAYVLSRAAMRRWRSPNEVFLLRTLLGGIPGDAAQEALGNLSREARNIEQIVALAEHVPDHLGTLQRASRSAPGDLSWIGYGDEPWLLTFVSPASFAAPVVMAVSSRQILPPGVTLRLAGAPETTPLGDGFVGLHVEWPPGRFAAPPALPTALYGSLLAFVLGAALLAGYLVLRDVHRETEMAAMRSHFVASVSHELKTPLTSIRAHAETLLMGRTTGAETTAEYLRTILGESMRLGRLVDSVLDLSRIEQGRKTYRLQTTRLTDVVRSATRTMEYPLGQSGFTLTVSSDDTEPTLLADREALTQAILNLLGNAMKYSGTARHIEVRMGTRDHEAFVDVVDHGIGIPRDEQGRIFERFHRVQSDETAGIAGAGLGLALALHVVEGHHGRIAVASAPGLGSTFSVRLPLQVST